YEETRIGEYQPDGDAHLRHTPEESTLLLRRILRCKQQCAAPFTADAEPLDQPEQHEEQWCRNSNLGICRQQADTCCRNPHHAEGDDECPLASDPVTDMTEDHAAERPDEK